MLWLIPVVGLVGKIIYDVITDEPSETEKPSAQRKTILELNFLRLENLLRKQSGHKIAILGQPGAGKSSLLKKMTNGQVKPLPVIGSQTDATDWSKDQSCNLLSFYEDYVFSDVPGYDTTSHPISAFSARFPFNYFDMFIFVVNGKLHSSDEEIFHQIKKSGKKVLIAKSFSESLDSDDIAHVENDIRIRLALTGEVPILYFSNRTGDGIESIYNKFQLYF